jgi:assimilatory nitrate reductase catalytic subunit
VLAVPDADMQRLSDPACGIERLAFLRHGRLAAVFVAPRPVGLARDWVAGRLGQAPGGVLAGRPGGGAVDPGPTVCACMGVGVNALLAALEDGRARRRAPLWPRSCPARPRPRPSAPSCCRCG